MGSDKHALFHKAKKILGGKNSKAREFAAVVDDIINGKLIPGLDKPKEKKKEEKEPEKTDDIVAKVDGSFKDTVSSIQKQLEAR